MGDNIYTISVTGAPDTPDIWGDPKTGVVKLAWYKITGTDPTGAYTAWDAGDLILPTIDPASPSFVPPKDVTADLVRQWAEAVLDLPAIKATIDASIAKQQARAELVAMLAPGVAAEMTKGVPI